MCDQGGPCRWLWLLSAPRHNTCVWIRLLRKINIPSVFGEITYWLTYCLCWKNKALCVRCGVWLVCFFPCLLCLHTWIFGADPGESFNITTRILQGDTTSDSLLFADGLLHLTSFLWVSGLIIKVKVFLKILPFINV